MDREYYDYLFNYLNPFFIFYFSIINAVNALAILLAVFKTLTRHKEISLEDFSTILHSDSLPEISLIIPVYNEWGSVIQTVQNVQSLSYRYKEIIIVNDGSTDNSLQLMIDTFQLEPIPKFYEDVIPTKPVKQIYQSQLYRELTLVDKENGKKFDANNAGINACRNSFFILIDADTIIDDVEFETLIRPILTAPETIGVGASVRIKAGATLNFNKVTTVEVPDHYLSSMQCFEYIRAFTMKQGWDYLGGNPNISGAFSIYRKDVILKVGGFRTPASEDMEMVIRLRRILNDDKIPFKLFYLPNPVAWTDGPSTLKDLGKQRASWQKGLLETLWHHKEMIFNPKYGAFGMFVIPYWILSEGIEPFIELLGIIIIIASAIMGFLNVSFFYLWLIVVYGLTVIYTIASIFIEELSFKKYTSIKSLIKLILYSFIESFLYRQIHLYWKWLGIIDFFRCRKEIKKEGEIIRNLIEKSKNIEPLQ